MQRTYQEKIVVVTYYLGDKHSVKSWSLWPKSQVTSSSNLLKMVSYTEGCHQKFMQQTLQKRNVVVT